MKKILILPVILLLLPTILAINLEIEKTSSEEVLINELDAPVIFDLKIKNLGATSNFEFYNLAGFRIFPVGTIPIGGGQTEEVQLEIWPIGEFEHKGFYTLNIFIKAQDSSEMNKELTFKAIDLADAFEIGAGEFDPESHSLDIYIQNKVNFNFENIEVKFSSAFFELEETLSLVQNQKKEFTIELNKEDYDELTAGFYTFNAEVDVDDIKTNVEGVIEFAEKNLLKTTEESHGFFINTKIIKKTNKGNIVTTSETTIKKNIISRLFTTLNPEPDIVQRQGLGVEYVWDRQVKPGETLEITIKTNWLFPFFIILFIVVIVVLAKQYAKKDLVLKKRVRFVKAKGGEFALKISIVVHAKKYVEKVNIFDRVPHLTKVYEKFGGEQPTRVSQKLNRIEWNFEKLEPGEIRRISYLIYSKIGVTGKFALPSTTAIYEKEGKLHESESNRAFFVAEQRKGDLEE